MEWKDLIEYCEKHEISPQEAFNYIGIARTTENLFKNFKDFGMDDESND